MQIDERHLDSGGDACACTKQDGQQGVAAVRQCGMRSGDGRKETRRQKKLNAVLAGESLRAESEPLPWARNKRNWPGTCYYMK